MKHFKILAVTLMLFSFQAIANNSTFMSLNTYHKLNETTPDKTDTYLSGLIAGYTLANAMLEKNNQQKIYCLPKGVTIKKSGIKTNLNMFYSLFKETKKYEHLKTGIGGYILLTLTETYPCK